MKEIGGVGFLHIPGVIDLDGYRPVYSSDIDAKNNGKLKPGQNYYTIINGIKVLAQVQ